MKRGSSRMSDGAQLAWSVSGGPGPPVVLLHGGPGLPDYLGDVAGMLADRSVRATVHRYEQRGTGRSAWAGRHRLARHVADLDELLDAWGLRRPVLVGHSYGTELACRFCLARPGRVGALLLLCGPFVGDWRDADRAERDRRSTQAQRDRCRELAALPARTEDEETELLALSWFTDHADPERGWAAACRAARVRRPVNWSMNRELGADRRADPLDDHVDELRTRLPGRTLIVGAAADPRPPTSLVALGERLGVPVTTVDRAGHEPWLEQPEAVRTIVTDFVLGITAD